VTRTRWRGRLDAAMGQHGNTRPADACARASMAQGTRPRQERVAHGEGRGRQGRGRQRDARRGRRRMGVPGYKLHSAAEPVEDRRGRSGRTGGRPRRRAEVPVEDRGQLASREPAAGIVDRRRRRQSSDSESRSLRTAGLAKPAGPRHSPATTGVRRGPSDGHGWTGSKAVETRASRAGLGWAADQDVLFCEAGQGKKPHRVPHE
jgi:hypothetical protein